MIHHDQPIVSHHRIIGCLEFSFWLLAGCQQNAQSTKSSLHGLCYASQILWEENEETGHVLSYDGLLRDLVCHRFENIAAVREFSEPQQLDSRRLEIYQVMSDCEVAIANGDKFLLH